MRLEEVSAPKPGDMMQSLDYSHVGIVKHVEEDKVILIEQNYKWSQGGQTVASVEREIGFNDAHFYRLIIDGEEKYFEEEDSSQNKLPDVTSMPSITGEDITVLQEKIKESQSTAE